VEEGYYESIHETASFDESARAPVQAADLMMPADNSDWTAANSLGDWAIAALETALRLRNPEIAEPLQGRMVMLAGCGPLSRMIAVKLKQKGAALIFASKDRPAAARLSQMFGGRQVTWEGIYTTSHDVLIVSRDPRTGDDAEDVEEQVPIHPGYLKPNMTVLDLTSYPRRSHFLTEARQRGCSIVAPASLLCQRACGHVERIGGQSISVDILRQKLAGWLDADEGETIS
jgi:3-dehydroquinate dehydratase / shikimate dehydrogenase